jgi:Rne/Rng family ribonuclease
VDQREQRDQRGYRGQSRRERHQPAITDLLSEGQEILVQIAKEPIAKKGARITSHIALPGRFLVYMPTVEHVGVSRKIESDTERHRLAEVDPDDPRRRRHSVRRFHRAHCRCWHQ